MRRSRSLAGSAAEKSGAFGSRALVQPVLNQFFQLAGILQGLNAFVKDGGQLAALGEGHAVFVGPGAFQREVLQHGVAVRVQHVSLGGNTDQGAQRIEQVNEQEGEHDGEEVQDANAGEIGLEYLTEGLAQSGEVETDKSGGDNGVHACIGVGHIDTGDLAEDAQHPGDKNAVQDVIS